MVNQNSVHFLLYYKYYKQEFLKRGTPVFLWIYTGIFRRKSFTCFFRDFSVKFFVLYKNKNT